MHRQMQTTDRDGSAAKMSGATRRRDQQTTDNRQQTTDNRGIMSPIPSHASTLYV